MTIIVFTTPKVSLVWLSLSGLMFGARIAWRYSRALKAKRRDGDAP
jgi:hypothetical protein